MIARRAKLVRDSWGPDRGAMMAIEADLEIVQKILDDAEQKSPDDTPATIACYNGPRSFTLAGSAKAIDDVAQTVANSPNSFSSIRTKRLNVTNAFHSTLVEPLMEELEQIGQDLTFREATISLERSTEHPNTDEMTPAFVADHMRNPVYFNQAVQRLARQHPSAIWLEAGSNSTITTMASRALGSPSDSHFQLVNITHDNGLQNLADTTLALWKAGLKAEYWPHHALQTYEYGHIFLPPYQFEKIRHWMELKKPQKMVEQSVETPNVPKEELPTGLWTFVGYQDKKQRTARFRINTMTKKYEEFVSGHLIAETAPICPATLEVDMAIEALMSLGSDFAASGMQPSIHNMENHSPICVDPSRLVWLDYEALDTDCHSWSWKIVSTGTQKTGSSTDHVHGRITFRSMDDPQYQAEFARYERLVGYQRCLRVLNSDDADDIIQGRNIYKTFAEIVDYGEQYRGLKRLVGLGNECAGRVVKKYTQETWLDTHLTDCFSQVGGIWVNCMTNRAPEDMFIASGCELLIRSPKIRNESPRPEVWDVFAYHHRESDKAYTTDVFTFDGTTGELMEVMLGIKHAKVAKASMQRILARLLPEVAKPAAGPGQSLNVASKAPAASSKSVENISVAKTKAPKKQQSARPDIKSTVRTLLSNVSGLEPEDIKDDTELAEIRIDSFMGMELAREVEVVFKCTLPADKLMEVTDFPSFVDCIQTSLPPTDEVTTEEEESDDTEESTDESSFTSKGPDGTSTPLSTLDETPDAGVDIAEYLAKVLGVGASDIQDDTLLVDLGVDSLLSSELRPDFAGKFEVHIPEDVSIEAMTVEELNSKINPSFNGKKSPSQPEKKTVAGSQKAKGNASSSSSKSAPSSAATPTPAAITQSIATSGDDLKMPATAVLDAFGEAKKRTDQLIRDYKIDNFAEIICPRSTQLCIALTTEAFEKLGVSIKAAKPGQVLQRIQYVPQHQRLVEYLYEMLEKEARLIDFEGSKIIRTAISPPTKSSNALLRDLLRPYPDWSYAMKLTQFDGANFADVLTAKTDGIKLIFGTEEGRELVGGLYCDHVFNKMNYTQMADFVESLISRLPMKDGPLRILELGAGTGGTTFYMAPLLARLGVPVEYTPTDLSPSMVAAARKKFKQYPFMKFMAHDIEKPVPADLVGTQHIVIASNAVHATHDLVKSGTNIRNALRPDGFLMMLEMTHIVPFIDIIFGLLEGWWLFDDGRRHAIAHQDRWERDMQSAGFGHIDYSDGHLPENKI